MRIFSGIQPTGDEALRQLHRRLPPVRAPRRSAARASSASSTCTRSRVDYDPDDLRERTLDLAAMLFATGLDPERSTVFAQSHVHRARRGGVAARRGHELRPARPDDAVQGQGRGAASSSPPALFTYPVLMAGDILLYQTDIVPIGDDQRQHLELARDVAERFNARFGETFKVPEGVYPEVGARIMDLQEPTKKMSTTGGTPQGTVLILDDARRDPQEVQVAPSPTPAREVRRARGQAGRHEPDRHHVRRHRRDRRRRSRRATTARGYGQFKADVAEAVVALLEPIQAALRGAARRPGRAAAAARASARRRRARRRRRRSSRCTSAWAS